MRTGQAVVARVSSPDYHVATWFCWVKTYAIPLARVQMRGNELLAVLCRTGQVPVKVRPGGKLLPLSRAGCCHLCMTACTDHALHRVIMVCVLPDMLAVLFMFAPAYIRYSRPVDCLWNAHRHACEILGMQIASVMTKDCFGDTSCQTPLIAFSGFMPRPCN